MHDTAKQADSHRHDPGQARHTPPDFVPGNHFDKYTTRNPIYRKLVDGFLNCAHRLLQTGTDPHSVLEVGCAEGDLASRLMPALAQKVGHDIDYLGTDISEEELAEASRRHPDMAFQRASAYELPFDDKSRDLVMACEVLEHLERPADAVAELARVTRKWALVSVPHEPLWCLLNLARLKYVGSMGNTPGHVQHFSKASIKALLETKFDIIDFKTPTPWLMALVEVRNDT